MKHLKVELLTYFNITLDCTAVTMMHFCFYDKKCLGSTCTSIYTTLFGIQLEDISLVEQYGKQIICESWSMFCELMSRIFIYACLADDFDLLLALRWWLKWYIIPGNLDANGSCVHAT